MSDNIETYNHRGYSINIRHDPDPQNPRTDCDNLTVMACFHKKYKLGDQGDDINEKNYSSWDEMLADIIKRHNPACIAQLYLYDHSGLRIKVGSFEGLLSQGHAEFDSGPVGFVWITSAAARKEYGWTKLTKARLAQLRKYIEADVETYDNYISGSAYGFVIEDADGVEIDDGSCWGFLGYDSIKEDGDAVSEAKSIIDHEIERRKKNAMPENNPTQMTLGLEGVN